MKIRFTKDGLIAWFAIVYLPTIFLTFLMISQWEENGHILGIYIIGGFWLLDIIVTIYTLIDQKSDPHPFAYLVDYETLIKYMREEDKFCIENKLEAGFHYYLYNKNRKTEIEAWYYTFSRFDSEKSKGDIYYYKKEEFYSLEDLIKNKIKKFDGYVLIELIDSDNVMLNDFRKKHKELNVKKYIKELKKK